MEGDEVVEVEAETETGEEEALEDGYDSEVPEPVWAGEVSLLESLMSPPFAIPRSLHPGSCSSMVSSCLRH